MSACPSAIGAVVVDKIPSPGREFCTPPLLQLTLGSPLGALGAVVVYNNTPRSVCPHAPGFLIGTSRDLTHTDVRPVNSGPSVALNEGHTTAVSHERVMPAVVAIGQCKRMSLLHNRTLPARPRHAPGTLPARSRHAPGTLRQAGGTLPARSRHAPGTPPSSPMITIRRWTLWSRFLLNCGIKLTPHN